MKEKPNPSQSREDLPEAEKHRVLAEQAAAVMNQMPPRRSNECRG